MIKSLISIFLLCFCHIILPQVTLIYIIRVDDIQSRNTNTVLPSIKHFQHALEQRGGKITWAVIPH